MGVASKRDFVLAITMFVLGLSPMIVRAGDGEGKAKLPNGYVDEAPLPEGFPPPGEVGKVVEKSYPPARSFSATGKGAFMKCFGYLAKHKHGMTAPVVMEYHASRVEPAELDDEMPVPVDRMHFLLEKPALDEPKQEGPVTVADMPKMRVLSIAHQGVLSAEAVRAAESKLKKSLGERPGLEAAGKTRILGYNGPSVAPEKIYWEIQLPVRPRAK